MTERRQFHLLLMLTKAKNWGKKNPIFFLFSVRFNFSAIRNETEKCNEQGKRDGGRKAQENQKRINSNSKKYHFWQHSLGFQNKENVNCVWLYKYYTHETNSAASNCYVRFCPNFLFFCFHFIFFIFRALSFTSFDSFFSRFGSFSSTYFLTASHTHRIKSDTFIGVFVFR